MLSLTALLAFLLTGQTAGPPPSSSLDGVWEGPRKRTPVGACSNRGPRDTTITFWTESDGTLHGRFTVAGGAPGEMDLKGAVAGEDIVIEAPRVATCAGDQRRYTVTLKGGVRTSADGKRVLKLAGFDSACAALGCSFRDEYTLTWVRAAPAPAVR
jgi:hypothetical protein